jgi:DNA polymerase-1
MDVVLAPQDGEVALAEVGPEGAVGPVEVLSRSGLAARVRELERRRPRWVWADTSSVYPLLLEAARMA